MVQLIPRVLVTSVVAVSPPALPSDGTPESATRDETRPEPLEYTATRCVTDDGGCHADVLGDLSAQIVTAVAVVGAVSTGEV
jgi:hypothetical protein